MNYYVNPKIPEGLTDAEEGHGRSFLAALLKYLAILAIFLIVVDVAARLLAPLVPFSWEKHLVPDYFLRPTTEASAGQVEKDLNALGQKVARGMDLPDDVTLTFHYSDRAVVNALATFGGHIVVFKGLLETMDSEDALAAVLAHEIGHIKNRDMLKGLVRVVSLSILLGALDFSSPASALGQTTGNLGILSYSRAQEVKADREATLTLGRLYGHIKGLELCFTALQKAAGSEPPEIISSHPDTVKRIRAAKELAAVLGFPADGLITPLSGALSLKEGRGTASP